MMIINRSQSSIPFRLHWGPSHLSTKLLSIPENAAGGLVLEDIFVVGQGGRFKAELALLKDLPAKP